MTTTTLERPASVDELVKEALGKPKTKPIFDTFFHEYFPKLVTYLERRGFDYHTAEDLASESMLNASRSYDKFTPEHEKSLEVWIYAIAKNKAIDHIRKKRRASAVHEDVQLFDNSAVIEYDLDGIITAQDALAKAREILTEKQKTVYALMLADRSYEEIGAELKIRDGAARDRTYAVRQKMRKYLTEHPELLSSQTKAA